MSIWTWLRDLVRPAPAERGDERDGDDGDDASADLSSPPQPEPPPAPQWPAALGKTFAHPDGFLISATPPTDVVIQGVPCHGGVLVSFHRNGQLRSATLAREAAIDGEALPAGTPIVLRDDGSLDAFSMVLAQDRVFHVRGKSGESLELAMPAGAPVRVEYGKLRATQLTHATAIDGFEFPAETELIFGDSGSLSHATARGPMTLRGAPCVPYETVVFEFGFLHELWPDADVELDGVPCMQGEVLRFFDNGRLARCYLARDAEISGVWLREGTRVYLDDAGGVIEGTLARDTTFGEIPVAAGEVVGLSETGALRNAAPAVDCVVGGIPCAAGQRLEQSEQGLIKVVLAAAHAIGEVEAPAGSTVVFDPPGTPARVVTQETTRGWGRSFEGPHDLHLLPSGALRFALPIKPGWFGPLQATLRAPVTLDGWRCAAERTIELYPSGALKRVVLNGDQRRGGYLLKGNTAVLLREDGEPQAFVLAEDATIAGVPCRGARVWRGATNNVDIYHERVSLHEDGTVSWTIAGPGCVVDTIPLTEGETVALHPSGRLDVGTPAEDWTHPDGWTVAAGTVLGLRPDGTPSLVTLAAPYRHGDTDYPAGAVLKIDEEGAVKRTSQREVTIDCVPLESGT